MEDWRMIEQCRRAAAEIDAGYVPPKGSGDVIRAACQRLEALMRMEVRLLDGGFDDAEQG